MVLPALQSRARSTLRLDHWSESLRGLNNPRGRGENDAISDLGYASVTIASFLIPTTRVFKPRRDSFGGLTDLEPTPGSAREAA